MKKRNKLKISVGVLFVVSLLLLTILFVVLKNKETLTTMYLGSDEKTAIIKDENGDDVTFVRGKEVEKSDKYKKFDDLELAKIYIDDETYYVDDNMLVENKDDAVLEKELWVYRTCSVYSDDSSSKLSGLINKGEKIDIIGHSELREDGSVERYQYDGANVYS